MRVDGAVRGLEVCRNAQDDGDVPRHDADHLVLHDPAEALTLEPVAGRALRPREVGMAAVICLFENQPVITRQRKVALGEPVIGAEFGQASSAPGDLHRACLL